jgi:hypothetical protein
MKRLSPILPAGPEPESDTVIHSDMGKRTGASAR